MESIITKSKKCYVCGATYNLHLHHCLYGTSNRAKADKMGLVVYLCQEHHTGQSGVHMNPNKGIDLSLKMVAQATFESKVGTREEFIREFGKSWL